MSHNQTIEDILRRRSIRHYLDKPIPETDIQLIVECGIHAPTARNKQNWHFTVIKIGRASCRERV